jgi:hypothetical protein
MIAFAKDDDHNRIKASNSVENSIEHSTGSISPTSKSKYTNQPTSIT